MSNVATLKLQGTSDLTKIVTDLKGISTESKTAGTNLKGVTTELDKGAKGATTFGQKLKGFGSQFSSSIATIGTLGGTVLNLSRQYQDLGDSQIAVDKAQLKVSKSTEATKKAQDALNKLVSQGVTSGAAYEQALLDVKQAQEQQSLAEQLLTERQEDHQRAQENFWIGLVPTITSAGASIMTVLNDIGGTKGLGGLKTALTGFGGKASGLIGGLISGLGGIGSAAGGSVTGLNGMTKATTGLGTAMKGLALSSLPVAVAIGGIALIVKASGMVIHEITSIMKGDMIEAVDSISALIDFYDKLAAVAPMGGGFAIFSSLKGEAAKLKAELKGVPQTIHEIDPAMQNLDNITQGTTKTIDSLVGGVMGLVQHANAVPGPANEAAAGIGNIGTSASGAIPSVDGLGGSMQNVGGQITTFIGGNVGLLDSLAKTGVAFVETSTDADPLAIAIANVGVEATSTKTEIAALTAVASKNASQFKASTSAANQMARALQNLNKVAYTGKGANAKPGQGFRQVGGGVQTKKNVNGPSYTLNGVTYYGSVAPPNRKQAASGMHEMVNKPTWILAGEAGEESVHIDKPGRNIGGGTTIVNVFLDGERIDQGIRYRINKFQGVMK